MILPLFLDVQSLDLGMKKYIGWDFERFPHMILLGNTGSGKSYAARLILGRIGLKLHPNARVFVCDFKGFEGDFSFLDGCPNYFRFTDCVKGVDDFAAILEARQQGTDKARTPLFLLYDELPATLAYLAKKDGEALKDKIGRIALLGRAFGLHLILSQQRGDTAFFSTGIRDQFSVVVALGNISKESAAMFGFDLDAMPPVYRRGAGYMLTNGTELQAIQVPTVGNDLFLTAAIRRVVR